ncbi:MAG: flagellar FlbD family protein [Butyrivibrio sp.]|jgi:flagellar protein FlbD|uniref:Flagellar protein FlbD n=1 Tax=Butyrivibrio hungatei TaxID=185008 RepID=A0A1G5B1S0_9FIRM|nr:flagellar FlbD family protein [Butyrivibrio hungatei]MBQ4218608.1 flagellar FlbD family protein [Butyrivibrio sp.]MBR4358620.1 flagellar FlbD family protein [Butyrivibrio sp.]MBR4640114.1 flagellar FlbD family protein [Butyrivibrio sp.]MEE3469990.1 flagellar FlbD family protein [Butyrivibrio hungatei]SCX84108.1 flagellar protein FlbD [Butyrivibrio hungatei]
MNKGVIELTKMDTRKILINPSMIESVESNPDTVVVLYTGRKLIVKESMEDIYSLINS